MGCSNSKDGGISTEPPDLNLAGEASAVRPFKVLLLGNSAVGKTTLVQRIATSSFDAQTEPTIGAGFSVISLEALGPRGPFPAKCHLWDTSGQELYRSITTSYFRGADAAIFCFDLTDESSRQSLLSDWVEDLADQAPDALVILVGCKADLVASADGRAGQAAGGSAGASGERPVGDAAAMRRAQSGHIVSAKTAHETARELELTLQGRRLEEGVRGAPAPPRGQPLREDVLLTDGPSRAWSPWRVRYVATSALSGQGVESVVRAVVQALVNRAMGTEHSVDALLPREGEGGGERGGGSSSEAASGAAAAPRG